MELLVAMAVMAILAVPLTAALRSGLKAWEKAEETTRLHHEARTVFERLAQELRNAVSFPGETFVGESDEIVFYTVRDAGLADGAKTPEIVRVMYKLGSSAPMDGQGRPRVVLQRTEQGFAQGDAVAEGVARDVTRSPTEIAFEYAVSGGAEGVPFRWEGEWKKGAALPAGVRMRLTLHDAASAGLDADYTKIFSIPIGALDGA